jgi:hypothetical protein
MTRDAVKANRMTWHISFQQTPGLPEQLLAGREPVYLRHFLDPALSAMRIRAVHLLQAKTNLGGKIES